MIYSSIKIKHCYFQTPKKAAKVSTMKKRGNSIHVNRKSTKSHTSDIQSATGDPEVPECLQKQSVRYNPRISLRNKEAKSCADFSHKKKVIY